MVVKVMENNPLNTKYPTLVLVERKCFKKIEVKMIKTKKPIMSITIWASTTFAEEMAPIHLEIGKPRICIAGTEISGIVESADFGLCDRRKTKNIARIIMVMAIHSTITESPPFSFETAIQTTY